MNKQDICSLYVGKCKYRWTYTNKSLKNNEDFSFGVYELYQLFTGNASYDRVQLILKRISDMSEDDKKECRKLMVAVLSKDTPKFNPIFDINEWRYFHTSESFLWLVEHGYALSDEWFENGIAVEGK